MLTKVMQHQSIVVLSRPSGSVRVFEALDSDPSLVKTIDAQSPVSRVLQLKVGAQVGLRGRGVTLK